MHAIRLRDDGEMTPLRVLINCEPPLLTEVVSLALSRIDGVEISRHDDRVEDVLVASSSTDWQSRRSPKTVLIDEASTLPALVETLTAWVSQDQPEDYTLLRSGSRQHNSDAVMNMSLGKDKAQSDRTPELIRFPVIEGTRGDNSGGRGS